MKIKNWIVSAGVGFVLGYIIQQRKKGWLRPEVALKIVKQRFQEHYDVSGSWIYMKPEQFHENDLIYDVYHGGITKHVNGEHISLEFFVDAKSGTVIKTNSTM